MRLAVPVLLALLSSACSGMQALASSTFEADDEGWTLSGNGDTTQPTLLGTGGNPAGHICGVDSKDGDIWYFVAPQRYLGDRSPAFGKRLTFDLKQGTIYNQLHGRDVVLNGGGLSIAYNVRGTPGMDWTPYSLYFGAEAGWVIDATSQPASEEDLRTVLRALTSLRIRGEFYDGPNDTACLDNVYFGTP